MCEFTQRIIQLQPTMSGRFINDLFPMNFRPRYQYQLVKEGHCPERGKILSFEDRRPAGRATRSLCAQCYTDLIEKTINYNCFICGRLLPKYKVKAQMQDSREISNHIDDGYCLDYFTLVHCKVVGGVDMTFLQDEQQCKIYVQNAENQVAPQNINKLEFQTLQNINNLKRAIHHNMVNGPFLPAREYVSNRNLLEAPSQQNTLEFRSNDIDVDYDSVSVIRLPQKV